MYESVLPIESVFHHMLNEDSVYKFGTMMIADIVHHLVKADLGFDQFLSSDYEDTDVVAQVTAMMIDSYSNLRGKDFARKHNARHGASHTESTRSKLGAIDELNKAKKDERIKKEDKVVKEGEEKDGVVAAEKQRHDDIDKLKVPELKERLRGLGLKVSGVKNDLRIRLKHYIDNPDAIATDGRGPAAKERAAAERAADEDHILEDVQLEEMEDKNHILEQHQQEKEAEEERVLRSLELH